MKFLCKGFTPVALVVALLTINAPARGGTLEITITDSLGHSLTVVDNGANDANPLPNAISVAGKELNHVFPELQGSSSLTTTFSQVTDNTQSLLSTTASLKELTKALFPNAVPVTFTITASQTGFTAPTLNPKGVNATGTFAFTNELAGTTATFKGGVDTTDTLFDQNTPAPLLTGTAPAGGTSNSSTVFSTVNPFAITNILTLNLQPGGLVSNTGVTAVAATPEPSTLVLACLAGVPFAIGRFRRWGRKNAAQKPFAV
jgi:hypothetical protein